MKIRLSEHFTYKRLLRFVFPSIIMIIFTSIYVVVDGLFVSNFVGGKEFAALNLIMPFIMIIGGMGFMVGTGGSALVAKILGSGDSEKANQCFTMMIYFTIIMGVVLTIPGILFIRPAAKFLRATDEMADKCVIYGATAIAFTTAFMLQNVFQSFLATAEKPHLGLAVTIAAGVVNALLDALFMVVFKWGLFGAALATGIGQVVGGFIPFIYFARKNSSLLHLTKTKFNAKLIFSACANGSSEFMTNISSSIVGMLYNFQLMRLIGEDGVSAYGVLMYFQFIFIAIAIGYSIGSAPIVSYHYGAQNNGELKNMLKKSSVLMCITGIMLMITARILTKPLAHLFVGYNENVFNITCRAFDLFSYAFIFSAFNIFASGFFTALNNGGVSATISFLRTLVFQAMAVLILPVIIGNDGIWLAITIAEIFAFIISVAFIIAKRNKYHYI